MNQGDTVHPSASSYSSEIALQQDGWAFLTTAASRDIWRLSRYFDRLFEATDCTYLGDWFAASRDRAEYIEAFKERVVSELDAETRVFVLMSFEEAAFANLGSFLDRWPDLELTESGIDVFPLDVSQWLRIESSDTAFIAPRVA